MTRGEVTALDRRFLAGGVALVLMAAAGVAMSPRLGLVAMMVLAVVVTVWLVTTLPSRVESIVWQEYRQPSNDAAHVDGRVRLLRARLASASSPLQSTPVGKTDRFDPTDAIVEGLVELIDDHLLTEHGVDRASSPETAATILGPDLTRFVTDPATARAMTRRNALATTLSRIEAL